MGLDPSARFNMTGVSDVPEDFFARIDRQLEGPPEEGVLTTTLDSAINWARKNSIWPMTFGLACCAIEMMSTGASRFDLARFGAEVFRGSPRQSDLMIIAGRVSNKMAPVIRQLYQQMPEPKWVISMGACATSTGVFSNYALIPVNQVIPVDLYVPGCPPRPEQLIHALMMLQDKIQKERGTLHDVLNL
jgi:NADH-quinone oxidoreductase subunit B